MSDASSLPDLARIAGAIGARLESKAVDFLALMMAPGGTFSLPSLAVALLIAALVVSGRRHFRGRPVRPRLLRRILLPRWLLGSRSSRADIGFFLLNVFATSGLIGWALLGYDTITLWVRASAAAFIPSLPFGELHPYLCRAILTLLLFLTYEFAYWLNHYLSHRLPFLWAFHRVHHTAEYLSPLTVFRIHPMDTVVYFNMSTIMMGIVNGLGSLVLNVPANGITLSGTNLISIPFIYLILHLQHSHVWIPFTGVWGRIFASPAHHQIHHSTDPAHFGQNLGSVLSIWDWMFGTLSVPSLRRQSLGFGVEPEGEDPHGITDSLLTPFARSLAPLVSMFAWLSGERRRSGIVR